VTRPAVFLDRDGTLNVRPPDHEYLTSERDFVWLPGAPEAVARFSRAGFAVAVVSNQRGVARGLVKPAALAAIEARIQRDLAAHDCAVEAFRYCIHNDRDACDCRKPKPGMLLELARILSLDLTASWMVGDSESDIQAGEAAGCATALIDASRPQTEADVVAASLLDASELIVARESVQV
jgi:D-glycero-D-manno-heptose 1,7-bisphosphate phosphatase